MMLLVQIIKAASAKTR